MPPSAKKRSWAWAQPAEMLDVGHLDVQVEHVAVLLQDGLVAGAVVVLCRQVLGLRGIQALQVGGGQFLGAPHIGHFVHHRHRGLAQDGHAGGDDLVALRVFLEGEVGLVLPGDEHVALAVLHKGCGGAPGA